jgi:predicted metalloprotease with PDZ domain
MNAPVRYLVEASRPAAHLFRVTLTVQHPDPSGQVVSMPTWIPGSYMIREFAMHIVELQAHGVDGPVAAQKLDKTTWKCETVVGPLRIEIEVYAWDLSVRKAHLDQTHGYFNGTSLFLQVHGFENDLHEVVLVPPTDPACTDWKVATTLPRTSGGNLDFGSFVAANYDELIDHPVEMGTFEYATFEARGIPHTVALTGRFRCDTDRLVRDLQAICEGHLDRMGAPADLPQYLFQIMVVGEGYGGLEHRTSTSLICSRSDLPVPGAADLSDGYRNLLALASHEYFHLWNVKRAKPAAFVPYDLTREGYTSLLWWFEGITTYYEPLGLSRVGLIPEASYLELLGRKLTDVMRRPGRHRQSAGASSFDAWTKYYRQDENAPNAIVSYYTKGAMAGLALDLTIRLETDGARSLDDVARQVWEEFARTGRGVPEDGLEPILSTVAGRDLSALVHEGVWGTGDGLYHTLEQLFEPFGIRLRLRPREGAQDRGGTPGKPGSADRGWIGLVPQGTTVATVLAGSPAQEAGISAGDVLVAIDGLKAGNDVLDRVAERRIGEEVMLHVFRRDELLVFTAVVARPPLDTVYLEISKDETPEQAARRAAWVRGVHTPA